MNKIINSAFFNWAIAQCIIGEYSTSGVLVEINEEIYICKNMYFCMKFFD